MSEPAEASEASSMGLGQMLERLATRLSTADGKPRGRRGLQSGGPSISSAWSAWSIDNAVPSTATCRATTPSKAFGRVPMPALEPGFAWIQDGGSRRPASRETALPSPSLYSSMKAEGTYRTSSMPYLLSDTGLQTGAWVRSSGGKPFATGRTGCFPSGREAQAEAVVEISGQHETPLPLEKPTGEVLDRIYPVKLEEVKPQRLQKVQSKGTMHRSQRHTACSMKKQPSSASPIPPAKETARSRILQVRVMLLSKFDSLSNAFSELLAYTDNAEISREQFARIMKAKMPDIDREEYSTIFDFLDADGGGSISLDEFQMACEVAPPVKNLEDLRLKWIGLGFPNMSQVVAELDSATRSRGDNHHNILRRLSSADFASALHRVGLEENEEHSAVFSALTAPNAATHVCISDLVSALIALGVPMILEGARRQVLARFVSFQEACNQLASPSLVADGTVSRCSTLARCATMADEDGPNPLIAQGLTSTQFAARAVSHFGMTHSEAAKIFRLIDIDDSGSVSPLDFLRALQLAEPDMLVEIARKKLRQRWRSIQEAFARHQHEVDTFGIALRPRDETDRMALEKGHRRGPACCKDTDFKSLSEVQGILATVGIPESDTATLFQRLDVYGDDRLTASDFIWGTRLCTPSSVMEDMRINCLKLCSNVRQVFDDWHPPPRESEQEDSYNPDEKNRALSKLEFQKMCMDLDIATGVNLDLIYDLLEQPSVIRVNDLLEQRSGIRVNDLIVALDTAAAGGQVPLKPAQLAEKARQQVREHTENLQNKTKDHRNAVRKRFTNEGDRRPKKLPLRDTSEGDPKGYYCSSLVWQSTYAQGSPLATAGLPKSVPHQFAQKVKAKSKEGFSTKTGIGSNSAPNIAGPQGSFQEQTLDLSVFSPSLDQCKLPKSRQMLKPLEPPRKMDKSHQKITKLLGESLEHSKEGGATIMQNLHNYYDNAGQTIAVDSLSLRQSAVSRYQEFKNMREAVAGIS